MVSFTLFALLGLCATALAEHLTPPICPRNTHTPFSCHNTTAIKDHCCTEAQGQILQTQFWDVDPATGPKDHWTIHGLWPDYCDGTYAEYCAPKREYTNISCILEAYGKQDLLKYMEKYWPDYQGDDNEFWSHEWDAHGTCYTTLKPNCFKNYSPQEEVVYFFERVVKLFKTLPTYKWLADAGITPSATHNYTNAQIMHALKAPRGVKATIECSGSQLSEVYYTFNLKGSVANGKFKPAEPVGEGNGCPKTDIQYLPKNLSSKPTATLPSCSASSSAAAKRARLF